jgi:hypothetical protein
MPARNILIKSLWCVPSSQFFSPSMEGTFFSHGNTRSSILIVTHHLNAVSQAIPAARHDVLVLDRAGWHTTSKLPRFPNVSLLPLWAGSPELHPAQQA